MCPCVSIQGWAHRPAAVRCCCTACIQSYAHSPPPPVAPISLVAISHAFYPSPYLSFVFLVSLLHLPLVCSTYLSPSLISSSVWIRHRVFNCSMHMCPCVSIRGWVHRSAAVRCCCTARIQSYAHSPHPPITFISLVSMLHPAPVCSTYLSISPSSLRCDTDFLIAACT